LAFDVDYYIDDDQLYSVISHAAAILMLLLLLLLLLLLIVVVAYLRLWLCLFFGRPLYFFKCVCKALVVFLSFRSPKMHDSP
jgi:membrane-anchored glycerophosphoryl diester phosphodiesterase (GDPDase)